MAKKNTKKSAKKTQAVAKPAKRRTRSVKATAPTLPVDVDAAKKAAVEADRMETDIFLRNQNTPATYSTLLLLRELWTGVA